jgi:hypothetical protein
MFCISRQSTYVTEDISLYFAHRFDLLSLFRKNILSGKMDQEDSYNVINDLGNINMYLKFCSFRPVYYHFFRTITTYT